jgi:cell shape-determining protein MreC
VPSNRDQLFDGQVASVQNNCHRILLIQHEL